MRYAERNMDKLRRRSREVAEKYSHRNFIEKAKKIVNETIEKG